LRIITGVGLISDCTRMRRSRGQSKDWRPVASSPFQKLAACTIDTSAERREGQRGFPESPGPHRISPTVRTGSRRSDRLPLRERSGDEDKGRRESRRGAHGSRARGMATFDRRLFEAASEGALTAESNFREPPVVMARRIPQPLDSRADGNAAHTAKQFNCSRVVARLVIGRGSECS
jgi:hypothetical protein